MTRAEELAWAGGVLEAKGYANHRPRGANGYAYLLRLTDTRPELLESFAEIVGVGKVRYDGIPASSVRPRWRWEIWTRRDIEMVLDLLEDHLFLTTMMRLSPPAEKVAAA